MKKNVVIIGGGPAGLMAAKQLDYNNVSYVLIEKNSLLGKKLLITGSGRCNVTNNRNTKDFIEDLTIKHKRFLYSSLNNFGTVEVIKFLAKADVPLVLENDLKYFPTSNKAIDVLNSLSQNIRGKVLLNTTVKAVKKGDVFNVETNRGTYQANYVVVATGSESFPKTGSTGDGARFAEKLGHSVIPFYPAETNVYSKQIAHSKEYIQGITILKSKVKIKGQKEEFNGPLLFTHFGLSGPVIQHASEFIYFSLSKGKTVIECSLSDYNNNEIFEIINQDSNKGVFVLQVISKLTIKRMAKYLLDYLGIQNRKLIEISKKDKQRLVDSLSKFEVEIDKVETKENAYVNGGGVSTKEINPKSFESKIVKSLYFIGETVDVHGPIGGYNITIALSSGYSAAQDIVKSIQKL